MKKGFYGPLAMLLLAMLMSACGYLKKNETVDNISEVDMESESRDSTIYGVCGRATSMNSLQLMTDNGDTLTLSLHEAQETSQVFGGMKAGDRLAVVANSDSTEAVTVINMSGLLGDWVMDDPIDGSGDVGISIKEGGVAESINHTTIQYRSWRIVNGQLEIVNIRDDGLDFEESGLYKMVFIGPDSLAYKDDADTYEYTRQKSSGKVVAPVDPDDQDYDDFDI